MVGNKLMVGSLCASVHNFFNILIVCPLFSSERWCWMPPSWEGSFLEKFPVWMPIIGCPTFFKAIFLCSLDVLDVGCSQVEKAGCSQKLACNHVYCGWTGKCNCKRNKKACGRCAHCICGRCAYSICRRLCTLYLWEVCTLYLWEVYTVHIVGVYCVLHCA